MTWFDRFLDRVLEGRSADAVAAAAAPLHPPGLTDMLEHSAPAANYVPSDHDVRVVRDVALHVTSKVVPIVEMHGRTMETALQANVMAVEVALRLALEAGQRTALTAIVHGADVPGALERLDGALGLISQGLADHRPDLARAIEAFHAGIVGGSVRLADTITPEISV